MLTKGGQKGQTCVELHLALLEPPSEADVYQKPAEEGRVCTFGGCLAGEGCRGGRNVDKAVSPPHELYLMKFVTSLLFI